PALCADLTADSTAARRAAGSGGVWPHAATARTGTERRHQGSLDRETLREITFSHSPPAGSIWEDRTFYARDWNFLYRGRRRRSGGRQNPQFLVSLSSCRSAAAQCDLGDPCNDVTNRPATFSKISAAKKTGDWRREIEI